MLSFFGFNTVKLARFRFNIKSFGFCAERQQVRRVSKRVLIETRASTDLPQIKRNLGTDTLVTMKQ